MTISSIANLVCHRVCRAHIDQYYAPQRKPLKVF